MSIALHHYTAEDLPAIRQTLRDIYTEVYEGTDPFHATGRFDERLTSHAKAPAWRAVIGYDGQQPVGFTYAATLPPGARWWSVMLTPLPDSYTTETGQRTLALFELMVVKAWRGTGAAKQLHDALLSERTEERVTLLVDPTHPKVKALYEQWGYNHIGDQQPFPDSPRYAVMVRPLTHVATGEHHPTTSSSSLEGYPRNEFRGSSG